MAGIASYGAYVPLCRLSRSTIAKAWGVEGGAGEKAVANWDEDSVTMSVEAAIDCLGDADRGAIDGLFFASTTAPYKEKGSASIIASALDLRSDIFTADFGNSLRAGTDALRAAVDAVKAGSAKKVLVVIADCRLPAPKSEFEMVFGDGAAAFIIGNADVAISIEDGISRSSEFMDIWRREEDRYPQSWEDRFIESEGYSKILREAVTALLKKTGLSSQDLTKAVFYAPNARRHRAMATALGFDIKKQVQDPLFTIVGNTGAAFAPMMLVAALEEAKPGDRILFANYGDGADAYILRVGEQLNKIGEKRGIKKHVASKALLPTYETYLRFRNLLELEVDRRVFVEADRTSLPVVYRESSQIFRLHGSKFRRCGGIQYPMQRVCTWCQAKDDFEEIRLSDRKGRIFTFSKDERAMVPDLPNVLCIVDLEGGGRFYSVMTDRDPAKLEIDMPVELTFRRIHEGSNVHNYFWKTRPVRC